MVDDADACEIVAADADACEIVLCTLVEFNYGTMPGVLVALSVKEIEGLACTKRS